MPAVSDGLSELLTTFAPVLLAYFRRRAAHGSDAADLLAECYAVAWRRRGSVPADPREALMWMYGVASNVLRNERRTQHRQSALVQRLQETYSPGAGQIEIPEVGEAIERLPPDQAELVRLVHWEELSVVEAARVLGISESTARGRYQRARAHLSADPSIRALRGALEGTDSETR